jgi:hypothetical protein
MEAEGTCQTLPNRTRGLEAKFAFALDFDKQHLVTKRKRDQTLAHNARWDFGAHDIISMVRRTALMSVPYDSSAFAIETRGFTIAHRRHGIQNAT